MKYNVIKLHRGAALEVGRPITRDAAVLIGVNPSAVGKMVTDIDLKDDGNFHVHIADGGLVINHRHVIDTDPSRRPCC